MASQVTGLGAVKIVLTTGQIIYITVKLLSGGVVGIGTAYAIEGLADAIDMIWNKIIFSVNYSLIFIYN